MPICAAFGVHPVEQQDVRLLLASWHDVPPATSVFSMKRMNNLSKSIRRLPSGRGLCCLASIGCDDATKLPPAVYWAVTSRTKVYLKHIVSDFSAAMRTLDVIMAHPSAKDVIEL